MLCRRESRTLVHSFMFEGECRSSVNTFFCRRESPDHWSTLYRRETLPLAYTLPKGKPPIGQILFLGGKKTAPLIGQRFCCRRESQFIGQCFLLPESIIPTNDWPMLSLSDVEPHPLVKKASGDLSQHLNPHVKATRPILYKIL